MTKIVSSLLTCASLALLASALQGQRVSAGRIVGWSSASGTQAGAVQVQDVDGNCQKATLLFKALGAASDAWAGGTAYDVRHESVWISDGRSILEFRLSDGKLLCKFGAMIMNRSAVLSGLAVDRKRRLLIQLETAAGYAGMRSYSLKTCPPTPLRDGCTMSLPQGYYSAGLAFDDVEDLVFISVTKPGFQVPLNQVWVADGKRRCKPLCKARVGGCLHFFGTDAKGLAYDPCKKMLYMSFGAGTVPIQVIDARSCQFKTGKCCTKQSRGLFRGLAWLPAWSSSKKGKSCLTKGCPQCSKLGLDLVGTPAIGNVDFGLRIHDGPTGAVSIIAIGPTSCGKGTHFLCGAIWLPGGSLPLYAGILNGLQCRASTILPLAIPVDPKLCGATLCAQAVLACGSSGYAISEAVQFSIAR